MVFYMCIILFFGLICVSEFCFMLLLVLCIILLNSFGLVKVVCCVVRWLLWWVV